MSKRRINTTERIIQARRRLWTPQRRGTFSYFLFYTVVIYSKNSTLESKQSTSSMSPPPPPDSFSEFTPQSTSSPLNNSFTSEYEAFPSEEKQKKSGIFSFFRRWVQSTRWAIFTVLFFRNSKKRRDEEGRPSFEQDANSEWLRIEKTLPPNSSPDKKVEEHLHILNFRQELEKSLAESKVTLILLFFFYSFLPDEARKSIPKVGRSYSWRIIDNSRSSHWPHWSKFNSSSVEKQNRSYIFVSYRCFSMWTKHLINILLLNWGMLVRHLGYDFIAGR